MTMQQSPRLQSGDPSLATLLRGRRHQAGLTIEQLAEGSWVSVRAIGNLERGESLGPQRRTVEALADALGLVGASREQLLSTARSGRRRVLDPPPSAMALPREVADFVGRDTEIALLRELAGGLDGTRSAVAVISGMPGIGKTSLAVRAAAVLADRFPEGQHFVDLRGLDRCPTETEAVLGRLLKALDPSLAHLPAGLDERSALLRELVSQRQAVVVLDNAADETQLRPLLPGRGRSLFIITSRRLLSGLEGVHRVKLGPLASAEATALLDGLAGRRPDTDPASLLRLAAVAGRHPLALRIIGNRLSTRPEWNPERLGRHLSDGTHRLHTLVSGDLGLSTAISSSYHRLSGLARTLFRRSALLPSEDADLELARVLLDRTTENTEATLDELVEAGLVETAYSGRYRLHDLLRVFAAERLEEEEPQASREEVSDRVASWLLDTAKPAACGPDPAHEATAAWPGVAVDLDAADSREPRPVHPR